MSAGGEGGGGPSPGRTADTFERLHGSDRETKRVQILQSRAAWSAVHASQSRIHRLALQRQHAENALVNPPQGLAADESLQRLDAECELPLGQRPLAADAAGAKSLEVLRPGVLRAVD